MKRCFQEQDLDPELKKAVIYSLGVVIASACTLEAFFSIVPALWELVFGGSASAAPAGFASSAPQGLTLWVLAVVVITGGLTAYCFAQRTAFKVDEVFGVRQCDYIEEEDIPRHAAVIAALSYRENLGEPMDYYSWPTPPPATLAEAKKAMDQLCEDTSDYWKDHPYQHILRAWKHHFVVEDGQEYIPPLFLLSSAKAKGDTKGSDDQIGRFIDVVKKLLSGCRSESEIKNLVLNPKTLRERDFEDFTNVKKALALAYLELASDKIKQARKSGRLLPDLQVEKPIIDVTGGQRTLAIAAAAVTLRENVQGFTYVSQNERKLKYYKLVPYREELAPEFA
jgi:hypothetical protein